MLAGCSGPKLQKQTLGYKVFPKVVNFNYEYHLGLPKTIDARQTKFVFDNDKYFKEDIVKSFEKTLYEELKATSAFKDVAQVGLKLNFLPSPSSIQEIRAKAGKDAVLLTQINKFNVNVRALSDQDSSGFVNLKLFANISYKMVLSDSETVIFLTTKDTSLERVVPSNQDLYKHINQMALSAVKNNIAKAKNDFMVETNTILEKVGKDEQIQKEFESIKQKEVIR
jgi:hypothetical protein